MASISQVSLSISQGSAANTKNVTVSGTMSFDAGEVGKSYRLEIKLLGEDKSGDNLPFDDSAGEDELYTFLWGTLFIKTPYKQFTVAAAGPQPFKETRVLSDETLDEDKGKVKVGEADINSPIFLPRKDEVYAKVSLSSTPVTKRSTTVPLGVGV
ncbi:MAG TPA: hypothetical protein V6C63_08165 [Allocoleopsis sp.]